MRNGKVQKVNAGRKERRVICPQCGLSFLTTSARKKYCSEACRNAFYAAKVTKKVQEVNLAPIQRQKEVVSPGVSFTFRPPIMVPTDMSSKERTDYEKRLRKAENRVGAGPVPILAAIVPPQATKAPIKPEEPPKKRHGLKLI